MYVHPFTTLFHFIITFYPLKNNRVLTKTYYKLFKNNFYKYLLHGYNNPKGFLSNIF